MVLQAKNKIKDKEVLLLCRSVVIPESHFQADTAAVIQQQQQQPQINNNCNNDDDECCSSSTSSSSSSVSSSSSPHLGRFPILSSSSLMLLLAPSFSTTTCRLNLSRCQLEGFPLEILTLVGLKDLDLSRNKITCLPSIHVLNNENNNNNNTHLKQRWWWCLPNLTRLNLKRNRLERFDDNLIQFCLPSLVDLDVRHNTNVSLPYKWVAGNGGGENRVWKGLWMDCGGGGGNRRRKRERDCDVSPSDAHLASIVRQDVRFSGFLTTSNSITATVGRPSTNHHPLSYGQILEKVGILSSGGSVHCNSQPGSKHVPSLTQLCISFLQSKSLSSGGSSTSSFSSLLPVHLSHLIDRTLPHLCDNCSQSFSPELLLTTQNDIPFIITTPRRYCLFPNISFKMTFCSSQCRDSKFSKFILETISNEEKLEKRRLRFA